MNEMVCGEGLDVFSWLSYTAFIDALFTGFPKGLILILALSMIVPVLISHYSSRIKGWFGEWVVTRVLAKLPDEYRQWYDVYLLDSDGHTTQIDHLVASKYGIFVIETKNYRGWIFGKEKQQTWTQSIYRKKYKFQNPLHQNSRHIRVLAESTGVSKDWFHNVIYFIGEAILKTELPENVMTNGVLDYILYQKDEVLSEGQLDEFSSDVGRLNLRDEKGIAKRHLKSLKARKAV